MQAESEPVSLSAIARSQCISAREFTQQYKDHISGFNDYDQKEHGDKWLVFEKNIGENLSIDEVAITNGELYTVLTNKSSHGLKGSVVAIVAGTKAIDVTEVIKKIPLEQRNLVKEVTLDMSNSMEAIVRASLPKATVVTDRFHVQQLVSEALQDIRISLRREALKQENDEIKLAREQHKRYKQVVYQNGDTKRQLLARSRYLLFKPKSKWTNSQIERAAILFQEFPELKEAYELSMMFRNCYENSHSVAEAKKKLNAWYEKIAEKNIESFNVVSESISLREDTILNYFINRSTNASAESFNAKLKGFRSLVRGVRDKKFFLFRVSKLYA